MANILVMIRLTRHVVPMVKQGMVSQAGLFWIALLTLLS